MQRPLRASDISIDLEPADDIYAEVEPSFSAAGEQKVISFDNHRPVHEVMSFGDEHRNHLTNAKPEIINLKDKQKQKPSTAISGP